MVSKIGPIINPSLSKGDTVDKPDTEQHRERNKGTPQQEPEPEKNDAMFFSTDAIRALLKQENVELDAHILACFDLLAERGVTSIPIHDEQPILEAVAEAAALLENK